MFVLFVKNIVYVKNIMKKLRLAMIVDNIVKLLYLKITLF